MAGAQVEGDIGRRVFLGHCASMFGAATLAGCRSTNTPEATAGRTTPESERARPGDNDWRLTDRGPDQAIVAYADRVSVRPGESFWLHVSTTARRFTVSAFRIGWYDGRQARLVWRSASVPGREHGGPRFYRATRTVYAGWPRTLTVTTKGWPEGAYLLRLDTDDQHQRYVPFVVRSTSGAGRTVLMHAPATWQAYNRWGGYSLYHGNSGSYEGRSLVVGFDRPYDGSGAEKFLVYERAAVVLAERLGIPLAYTTGIDIDHVPDILHDARSIVVLGHDEYWTPRQRAALTQARDTGTNIAILGANTCFRRIRLESGKGEPQFGPGIVACYKTDFDKDPNHDQHPDLVTTDFRADPGADPESSLTGVLYEGYPTDAPYVVHNPRHWLYEGTGARQGESFDHLVGVEYDRVTSADNTPANIEIIAHSPLKCAGKSSHQDSAYYTVPSGAGVFATGTMRWVEALMAGTRDNGRNHRIPANAGPFVTRTTENALRAFAEGPCGKHRPIPRNNVNEVYGEE